MSEIEQKPKDNDAQSDREEIGEVNKKASPSSSKEDKIKTNIPIKKDISKKTKEVSIVPKLTEDELSTLDYNDFSTPARMLALGQVLAKSQLVPLKKAEDVVVALMTGKELGLPFITSVSQIYPINGRPTLGVHIQKAILLKNGILIEKVEDAEPLYEFVEIINEKPSILFIGTLKEQPKDSRKKHIDTRTKYKFTRQLKQPDGSYKDMIAYGSFSLKEAAEAELTAKDVWVKYWRRMLDARAFTNGAREIADDLLLGIMTPNELDTNYYINNQGEEVHTATIVKDSTEN